MENKDLESPWVPTAFDLGFLLEEVHMEEFGHFPHGKEFQTLPCQSSHGHI